MELNNDIILINFMCGSGGVFLCNFLTSAKLNKKQYYQLGRYGSTHTSNFDLELPIHGHGLNMPDQYKIDRIKQFNLTGKVPPFFTTIHHQNIVNLQHNKIIHIHYDKTDIEEIAIVFIRKHYLENELKNQDEPLVRTKNWKGLLRDIVEDMEKRHTGFQYIPDNRFCNISWSDMYRNDPTILINKLSSFTEIPIENFFVDNLLNWRGKTREAIAKYGHEPE